MKIFTVSFMVDLYIGHGLADKEKDSVDVFAKNLSQACEKVTRYMLRAYPLKPRTCKNDGEQFVLQYKNHEILEGKIKAESDI